MNKQTRDIRREATAAVLTRAASCPLSIPIAAAAPTRSVGRRAVGLAGPRTILGVLICITVTMATGVALLVPTPAANAERIVGTAGDDRIVGTAQRDQIHARRGNDHVRAGEGADLVVGGPGGDWVVGGPGNDIIMSGKSQDDPFGGGGNDTIYAGKGPDFISDGYGRDEVYGGGGDDWFPMDSSGGGADIWYAGPGDDFFDVYPDGRPDQITCGPGRDTVRWLLRHEKLDQTTGGCERKFVLPASPD